MDVIARRSLIWKRLFGLAFGVTIVVACSSAWGQARTKWEPPTYAAPNGDAISNFRLVAAEDSYLYAVALEEQGCPRCVEEYLKVAGKTWSALEHEFAKNGQASPRTLELYRSAVAKLLVTGQQFGRWHASGGLVVSTAEGTTALPTHFYGFSWSGDQFQHFEPVGEYTSPELTHAFRSTGVGAPLVVSRSAAQRQPFTRQNESFAATAIVRYCRESDSYQLEFYDPLRETALQVGSRLAPLARDLTAPIAYEGIDEDRRWLTDFLQPGVSGSGDGLFMIEPYQPGKIPVVFIHGLLSDPATWREVVNELRSRPDLAARYQWWGFQYSTGEPFFTSAAVLRRQLRQARATYDPAYQDQAFGQMVLIGHSMGGIVAKLQVTNSGDQLWQTAATRPLGTVVTDHKTRELLRESFYFQPSPDVRSVVFIGTPHAGSTWARRPVGRLGSLLVEPSPTTVARHTQLIRDNPGLFRAELQKRFPTSIDLLEPRSPLLGATMHLRYAPWVRLHSVVGTGQPMCDGAPGDGVVPVASAHLPGVASEISVPAEHEYLHHDPATIAELERLLRLHWQSCGTF